MCTQRSLQLILHMVCEEMQRMFNEKLKSVILYGSYARGDYDNESDIDIMVLVDMSDAELNDYNREIVDFEVGINLEYDVVLSIFVNDCKHFEQWLPVLPFYRNIKTEGVVVSERHLL
ncbi:MAG: nucleotidyltransferase domain-containing protein [Oscillospiraceae bacterium]|nr:nucleotidyltransferase domain-containing protein [Oscillospiraceae bacterium]